MERQSRRRPLLLAVPPLVLALALLRAGPTPEPSATTGAPGDPSRSSDGVSLRLADAFPSTPSSSSPSLRRRTIRVTDPAGTPLAARVRVAFSQDGFRNFETLDVAPDAQGRLPLELDPSAWVVLSVHAPGHVSRWQPPVAWAELQDADLDVELSRAVSVDGVSRWIDGRPMAGVRLSFRPFWPPGEFAGQVASQLKIVDEEITTDAAGRFSCASLRPGGYRVSFPDHPRWPPLNVGAEELAKGSLALRAGWNAPAPK